MVRKYLINVVYVQSDHAPPETARQNGASMHKLTSPSELLTSLQDSTDVISWINQVLDPDLIAVAGDARPELTNLDRRVTELIGMLEIGNEDTSAQVERLIDDISRSAPRLTYDLHFMRDSALSLQGVLQDVEARSHASLGAETSAALVQLHYLDTVKRNMEAAREVLREAESWGTLESDVTSLLGEKNYEKAAERLGEANKSMIVFENTPEYENRRTLMVNLQNQLEAALSSALVAAVNSQDVAVCRNYFSIFVNIQRESEFRNYYYGSRRAPLVDLWQSAQLSDCGTTQDSASLAQPFSAFLTSFYSSFVSILQTERTSVPAIFPDPQSTLSTLITSTLSSFQPTFSQRLAALVSHYGPSALPKLIAAFVVTQEFAVATDKILEKVGYSAMVPSAQSGDAESRTKLRRRSSARMSMSLSRRISMQRPSLTDEKPSSQSGGAGLSMLDWDTEVFEPFIDYQSDYAALERRFLDDVLEGILRPETTRTVHSNPDHARLLRERAVDVFGAAEDAMSRCMNLTHGYGSVGLVQAVDDLVRSFADKSAVEVTARRSVVGGSAPAASGDLSDLDYTAEDWSEIQALLHLLEAVRALLERATGFETKLRSALVQLSATFRLARGDPAGVYFSGTTRGEMQLLSQSPLNSMELHDLLNKVDPENLSRGDASFLAPTPPSPDPRRSSQGQLAATPAVHSPLLVSARTAISGLAKVCQVALQDTILSPLYKHLASYAISPAWSAPGDPKAKRTGGSGSATNDVQVPTFSLSPSDTIQRVAEGLLNLPRLFEVYADDDALAFSLDTLPFISVDFLRALAGPAVLPDASTIQHTRRSPSLSLKAPTVSSAAPSVVPLTPEAVAAAWLSSLGLALLKHLTSEVLPHIRTLTPAGAAQLASDLGYLSNIVMVLNVECPELERWREWVELDDVDGRKRLAELGKEDGNKEKVDDEIVVNVAKMRGWAT